MLNHAGDVRYVILTCHSYVTVYIYSHLESLASYFRLQVSRTLAPARFRFKPRSNDPKFLWSADESLTSLAVYFCNWHMFREYMNNITC